MFIQHTYPNKCMKGIFTKQTPLKITKPIKLITEFSYLYVNRRQVSFH